MCTVLDPEGDYTLRDTVRDLQTRCLGAIQTKIDRPEATSEAILSRIRDIDRNSNIRSNGEAGV